MHVYCIITAFPVVVIVLTKQEVMNGTWHFVYQEIEHTKLNLLIFLWLDFQVVGRKSITISNYKIMLLCHQGALSICEVTGFLFCS